MVIEHEEEDSDKLYCNLFLHLSGGRVGNASEHNFFQAVCCI